MEITKEKIQDLANKLLIRLNKEEEKNTYEDFETILKQMAMISDIDGIEDVEPLVYPFLVEVSPRDDVAIENISHEDMFYNAKDTLDNEIKVPKVVGEE